MAIRPIENLVAADWHSHRPPNLQSGDQFWEWWYFEVDFTLRGDEWKIITVLHHPHAFDPRRVLAAESYTGFEGWSQDPMKYAGITSYVVCQTRNESLIITRKGSSPTGVAVPKTGSLYFEIDGLGRFEKLANGKYKLRVHHDSSEFAPWPDLDPVSLDMWVEFTPRTPGFKPLNGIIIDHGSRPVHWVCPLPNPDVEIKTLEVKEDGQFHIGPGDFGSIKEVGGYHDHQWGDGYLFRDVGDWSWGRLSLPRGSGQLSDKLIFFAGRTTSQYPGGSYQNPALVLASAVDGTVEALTHVPNKPAFRGLGHRRYPGKPATTCGIKYYRQLEINARTSAGSVHHYKLTHGVGNNVDAWPFYLRFLPTGEEQGTNKQVRCVSEYARWDRVHRAGNEGDRIRKRLAISEKMNKTA